jgi:signal transduction histidine kinase
VERFVKDLIERYRSTGGGALSNKKLDQIEEALRAIQRDVDYSNAIIDILLVSASNQTWSIADSRPVSIREIVEQAIDGYPYANSRERQLVACRLQDDFVVDAPPHLLLHVLLNLIKNSLYHVQRHGGRSIEVGADAAKRVLYVLDDGPGIQADQMKLIFERFYTTTRAVKGAGIGLSFCKLVMDGIGGEISCSSTPGLCTRFDLSFPAVRPPVGDQPVMGVTQCGGGQ